MIAVRVNVYVLKKPNTAGSVKFRDFICFSLWGTLADLFLSELDTKDAFVELHYQN